MQTRRELLQDGAIAVGVFGYLGLLPRIAAAFDPQWLATPGVDQTLKRMGIQSAAEKSPDVRINGPDIAENGSIVALTLSTTLPNVSQLALLVENNPYAMSALFEVLPTIEPEFMTRTEMMETSNVYAIAITDDGRALYDVKEVKVSVGGCGG